jgi:hypothetical protein
LSLVADASHTSDHERGTHIHAHAHAQTRIHTHMQRERERERGREVEGEGTQTERRSERDRTAETSGEHNPCGFLCGCLTRSTIMGFEWNTDWHLVPEGAEISHTVVVKTTSWTDH